MLTAVALFVAYKAGGIRALILFRTKRMKSAAPEVGQPVTLVLTDIKGSTELWEWDTELAAQVGESSWLVWAKHDVTTETSDCLCCRWAMYAVLCADKSS